MLATNVTKIIYADHYVYLAALKLKEKLCIVVNACLFLALGLSVPRVILSNAENECQNGVFVTNVTQQPIWLASMSMVIALAILICAKDVKIRQKVKIL